MSRFCYYEDLRLTVICGGSNNQRILRRSLYVYGLLLGLEVGGTGRGRHFYCLQKASKTSIQILSISDIHELFFGRLVAVRHIHQQCEVFEVFSQNLQPLTHLAEVTVVKR